MILAPRFETGILPLALAGGKLAAEGIAWWLAAEAVESVLEDEPTIVE